mgnify:CR=1 FL=1
MKTITLLASGTRGDVQPYLALGIGLGGVGAFGAMLHAVNHSLAKAALFLLAGAGLVSMHLTHGNLRGLTLHLRPAAPVHAGSPAVLEVVLINPGGQRHGLRREGQRLAAARRARVRRRTAVGPGLPDAPHGDAARSGEPRKNTASVPPRVVWFTSSSRVVTSVGRRERKFTTPPRALLP